MPRPALEVAEIFRDYGLAWRRANAGHVSLDQLKVMSAIACCRTAALGGHVARCEDCTHTVIAYNSCRNRHCPKCQGAAATEWLAAREADLLPVAYFHVVFTLPAAIAAIAYQNKAAIYDILFTASAETMIAIAADPKHLHRGASHLGIGDDAPSACAHDRAGRRHLSRRITMGLVQTELFPARAGSLAPVPGIVPGQAPRRPPGRPPQFFGNHAHLDDARAFKAYLAPLHKAEWVVYAKRPFGGPQAVLAYLSRYTHRVAISNRRLISFDQQGVTFKWKDYRIEGRDRYKLMTLATDEFIRRFLIHVLPRGFHRIRHYGLLAKAVCADNIARARELLAVPKRQAEPAHATDDSEPHPCPHCGGRMIIIETFERGSMPRHRPTGPMIAIRIDTS